MAGNGKYRKNVGGKYLSTRDVAQELGVSMGTVYAWLKEGKLVGFRVGRQHRFSRAEVDAFMQNGLRDVVTVQGEYISVPREIVQILRDTLELVETSEKIQELAAGSHA